MNRLSAATKETTKVMLWVFVSAGLMAIITWALGRQEFLPWYGLLNIALYWLKEVSKSEK